MSKTIQPVSFGNKAMIATAYGTKGREGEANNVRAALIPIVSAYLSGATTFDRLITLDRHNSSCPVQVVVWGKGKIDKTKSAQVRNAVFSLAVELGRATSQEEHDNFLLQCETALYMFYQPAATRPKAKGPTALETAQAETAALHAQVITLTAERDALTAERDALTAERDALTAERDALTAEVATLRALLTASAPTSAHAMA